LRRRCQQEYVAPATLDSAGQWQDSTLIATCRPVWQPTTIGHRGSADRFDAQVRALYEQMTVITVTPEWARLLDFETTAPGRGGKAGSARRARPAG